MKKIFFTIPVLLFAFLMVGPVMAKGIKAPKSLCLEGGSLAMTIATSKGGKAILGDTKIINYNIQGVLFHSVATLPAPIAGAGFISGDDFQFSFSGVFPIEGGVVSIDGQVIWEVGAPIAPILLVYNSESGGIETGAVVVDIIDCADMAD